MLFIVDFSQSSLERKKYLDKYIQVLNPVVEGREEFSEKRGMGCVCVSTINVVTLLIVENVS